MTKTPPTESVKIPPAESAKTPPDELSYEQARRQLVEVVNKLESGGASLTESLKLWEQGEMLAAVCQQWLTDAKLKVAAAQAQPQNSDET